MTAGNTENLPYLTADLPGVGGMLKSRYYDFRVYEVPLYRACGEGTHVFALIEKSGVTTTEVASQLARSLGVPRLSVGYAGLKDVRAVTRQWLSVEHVDPEVVAKLTLPKARVLHVVRHTNKIKIGHLRSNFFRIKIRMLECPLDEATRRTEEIMDVLSSRGAPNYFGPQRFGNRCDSHTMGDLIVSGDYEGFMDAFLGQPDVEHDLSSEHAARLNYEAGDYSSAYEAWPAHFADQRRAMRSLVKSNGDKKRAFNVIDRRLKRFFIAALQSELFNQVVSVRMPNLDQLLLGDMAYLHERGACFRVEDCEQEQPRCDVLEISPTGPLVGPKMVGATGPAGEIENAILANHWLEPGNFGKMGAYRTRGSRRPMRMVLSKVQISSGSDDAGEYVQVQFGLDPGCYATTVMREVTKNNRLC